ncbi:MAG TPA: TetR/AcrR family transcriptional regulator [candidate division Zixibacteria bacterium]|nr:TetR/AcrR family transcriptional regulator [candidate division Zixibacteria bacterium]
MNSDKDEKRRKILEAAGKCIAEKGYSAASMNDIAKMAGMTKGGLYWYFDSKRAIFMAILDEMIMTNRDIWEEIDRLSETLSPRELLRQGGIIFIKKLTEDPMLHKLYNEVRAEAMKDPEVRKKLLERISMAVEFIKKYFRDALEKGAVRARNTKRLSLCVVTMIMGLANANWMTGSVIDPIPHWNEFVDDLFDGVARAER